jgi:2',3'-cyclic-nucleotide 2'-phosphodiesterase (5'-nucleotidase family)
MILNKHKRLSWIQMAFIVVLVLFISMMSLSNHSKAAEGESESTTLTIVHTNDIHAQIDNFAKLAAYNESQRSLSDAFLYLDAGDIFSGNPVVDLTDGEPMIELLDAVGLDALTIGNHEFDYGIDALNKNMLHSEFQWLSANMEIIDSAITPPEPYFIFEENGLKIGVLGLTQAPPATAPKHIAGIEFQSYAETAEQYAHLRDEVDVFIGLTHIGHGDDIALAEQFDLFDIIIGGHSHTTLSSQRVVNGTPIVQTGSQLNNIGKLTFEIDHETKEVNFIDYTLQNVANLSEEDAHVKEMIHQYNKDMEEILDVVIGETTGMSRDVRYVKDAPLGNFWTDAMRNYVGSDIAFTNNGGIRANIDQGELTAGDIYLIEPFGNQIMEINMTGQAIKDVIEYSYSREGRNQIDLQTSGLHYKIITDTTGNLTDVELSINNQPLELDKIYNVAVPDYIGSGGSGYNLVGEVVTNNAGVMTQAMIDYANHLTDTVGTIDYKSEGRISIEKIGKDNISVAEAIESNEGEATVIGYIVGHVISVRSYNSEAPFANDHNFLLADDPNETDMTKMLPVQITASFRDKFGLGTNPNLIGAQVAVQGNLEAYFSAPGLKLPKSITNYEITSIADARQQEIGTESIIEGTVLVNSGAWGANSFYVHDGTGGILVYQYDYEVEEGDYIRLTGTIGEFNDEIQFDQVSNIEILEKNHPLPAATEITIDDVGESLLGELITLRGATITAYEELPYGTFEFLAEKDGETVLIRVDNWTGLSAENFMFEEGDVVDITGLVGIYQGVYQIKPRSERDVIAYVDENEEDDETPGDEETPDNGEDDETTGNDGDTKHWILKKMINTLKQHVMMIEKQLKNLKKLLGFIF